MDAYAKTWLQFLFPAYIWAIVITIIVSSHYSTTVSRLSGNNAIQVLATLFLLSYAKLLCVSITIFSSAVLVYPGGYRRRLWLYDGNINYLQGKHIPLFVHGWSFAAVSIINTVHNGSSYHTMATKVAFMEDLHMHWQGRIQGGSWGADDSPFQA